MDADLVVCLLTMFQLFRCGVITNELFPRSYSILRRIMSTLSGTQCLGIPFSNEVLTYSTGVLAFKRTTYFSISFINLFTMVRKERSRFGAFAQFLAIQRFSYCTTL